MFRLLTQVRLYSGQARSLKKVLIANRGEIACRIIKTARHLGVKTVAVYSDADRNALHVSMADEAIRLGLAPSQDSYLNFTKVLSAAKNTGAEAIHPGYGFLSENTEFADLCQKSGIIFIGPPASAIRDMGIKSISKKIMSAAKVPVIQGYHSEDQSHSRLKEEARAIGFPVMIKAVRGGGGKGMRIVLTEDEFDSLLDSAKREAKKSFGDEVMLLEKFVEKPRHVEVQVFGDSHGNYVYLFERDCSVQRRHQKIIEEAPAPGLTAKQRQLLGETAVRAAQAVNYVGAGTVEFIMDKNGNFYFMEMNTRLQVEHPVTEMITGVDLVEWQLMIAAGMELPLKQHEIELKGHSFEARVYAENPSNNFMPEAGNLAFLGLPTPSQNVRIETGVRQGDDISVHYDPMIAKLVVWGKDRTSALMKLHQCLSEYNIVGLPTNVGFLMDLARHKEFVSANVHTDFIKDHHNDLFVKSLSDSEVCAAVFAIILKKTQSPSALPDPYSTRDGWLLNDNYKKEFRLQGNDKEYLVKTHYRNDGNYVMTISGKEYKVSGTPNKEDETKLLITVDDHMFNYRAVFLNGSIHIFTRDNSYEIKLVTSQFLNVASESFLQKDTVAPMPGVIEKIMVNVGDQVKSGDPLVVMTAMKMEYILKAHRTGVVEHISCKVGDSVAKNHELVTIKQD